jgi:beta-lactamase regulating signal transducer with metallopeptidase domain
MIFPMEVETMARLVSTVALTSLWQGTMIFSGLALCLRLGPRTTATQRFALWAAAFVAMLALPLLPSVAANFAHSVAASGAVAASESRPWLELNARWSFAIAALWLLIALTRLVTLAMHAVVVHRIRREATPVLEQSCVRGVQPLVGRGCAVLCATTRVERPCVVGFFHPRILIPDWLLPKLTDAELRQVVLHECEHLRRCDDWTNLAQKLALALFPLNPGLAWAERRLCREREMACDEGVVRQTRAPRAYAACLASLAERGLDAKLLRRVEALSLGAWQRRPELAERVYSLLRGKQTLRPAGRLALAGVLGCGLCAATVGLARCPQLVGFVTPEARVSMAHVSAAHEANHATGRFVEARVTKPQAYRVATKKLVVPGMDESATTQVAQLDAPVQSSSVGDAVLQVVAQEPQHGGQQWVVLTMWRQADAAQVSDANLHTETERQNAALRALLTRFLEHQAREREAQARAEWLIFEL